MIEPTHLFKTGARINVGNKRKEKNDYYIIYENVKVKLPISKESKLK